MVLIEVLALAVLAWLVLAALWLLRTRARTEEAAGWRVRTRALRGGGHVVELVCHGEPAQEVRRLDAGLDWDELGTELAEAVSEAEARAATLNALRRR